MEREETDRDAGSTAASAVDWVVAIDRPQRCEERILQNMDLDTEDSLDAQGASSDLVLTLVEREDKSLNIVGTVSEGDVFIALPCRRACLRSMSALVQVMNLPPNKWFQAVVLFDVYCQRKPLGSDFTHIPSLCVALIKILKKTESNNFCWQEANLSADVSCQAARLAQWLQTLGVNATEGSAELIAQQEQHLLETLGWRVNLPSLEQWLTMFCARFNMLTRMSFLDSVNRVWRESLSCASRLVFAQPSSSAIPSRRLARGIICMMLINEKLIPLQTMRPQRLSSLEWHLLFAEGHPHGIVLNCLPTTPHSERILTILPLVTGHDVASLQTDCELAVIVARQCLRDC